MRTSRLTSEALAAKKRRGELTGRPPYGTRVGEDGITLESEPHEVAAVETILELRADGMSYSGIARELNARGVPARGRRWYPMTVSRIVQNGPEGSS